MFPNIAIVKELLTVDKHTVEKRDQKYLFTKTIEGVNVFDRLIWVAKIWFIVLTVPATVARGGTADNYGLAESLTLRIQC